MSSLIIIVGFGGSNGYADAIIEKAKEATKCPVPSAKRSGPDRHAVEKENDMEENGQAVPVYGAEMNIVPDVSIPCFNAGKLVQRVCNT